MQTFLICINKWSCEVQSGETWEKKITMCFLSVFFSPKKILLGELEVFEKCYLFNKLFTYVKVGKTEMEIEAERLLLAKVKSGMKPGTGMQSRSALVGGRAPAIWAVTAASQDLSSQEAGVRSGSRDLNPGIPMGCLSISTSRPNVQLWIIFFLLKNTFDALKEGRVGEANLPTQTVGSDRRKSSPKH